MIIASQSSSSLTLHLQRTIPNLSPRSTSLMISMTLYRIWINRTFINNVYYSDLTLSSFVWKAGIPNSKILAPPLPSTHSKAVRPLLLYPLLALHQCRLPTAVPASDVRVESVCSPGPGPWGVRPVRPHRAPNFLGP